MGPTLLSTSLLLAASSLPLALCGLYDTPAPLLGFASPKPFLGLDDGFSKAISTVAFIPGFHTCGTLLVLSVDGLQRGDFDLLPRGGGASGNQTAPDSEGEEAGEGDHREAQEQSSGLMDRYLSAPTTVIEDDALEGTVLAWAKGWRRTCGRGEANKEVRIAKVVVDGAEPGREAWVRALDAHIVPYLEALPPAPHNSVVLLTTVSAATLRQLFDTASPPPSSPSPNPPSSPNPNFPPDYPSKRRHHGRIYAIVHSMVSLAVWGAILVGLAYGGRWGWRKWEQRKKESEEGAVRLPLTRDEEEGELDLDAE
ncbi:hypothetical protein JCM5296_004751 [Sporobolomyces johnsonii]